MRLGAAGASVGDDAHFFGEVFINANQQHNKLPTEKKKKKCKTKFTVNSFFWCPLPAAHPLALWEKVALETVSISLTEKVERRKANAAETVPAPMGGKRRQNRRGTVINSSHLPHASDTQSTLNLKARLRRRRRQAGSERPRHRRHHRRRSLWGCKVPGLEKVGNEWETVNTHVSRTRCFVTAA